MTEEELFLALEKLNTEKKQLVNSKQYKLGKAIDMYFSDLKKFDFKKILNNVRDKISTNKIRRKYNITIDEKIDKYEKIDYKNKKIVVYTSIVGNYDNIQVPLVKFNNVDFVILTDNPRMYKKYEDLYIIKKIPSNILKLGNVSANRYVKFHPYEFFSDYDYAIYLDGNIRVVGDVRQFIIPTQVVTGIAMHRHRYRNCTYNEAMVCKYLRRGNWEQVKKQIEKYKKNGFPSNYGLNEANVIVSDLNNKISVDLLNKWWLEFYDSGSMRDQIAWPYVLWNNNYQISDVGNLGYDVYKNAKIEVVRHI